MKETNRNRANVAKRRARQRKLRNRRIALTVCLMLVVMVASIGGTVAWLTAQTAPVVNTFTTSDIKITLTESANLNLKMVPGTTITKDPKVTVKAGSEACYLFVKVDKSANFDTFMTYEMATGWTALGDAYPGVYYQEIASYTSADTDYVVLKNNQVRVLDSVTKTMMNAIDNDSAAAPTMTFTAYAVQKDGITSVTDAWAKVNP